MRPVGAVFAALEDFQNEEVYQNIAFLLHLKKILALAL
jgi:hypothetical protein